MANHDIIEKIAPLFVDLGLSRKWDDKNGVDALMRKLQSFGFCAATPDEDYEEGEVSRVFTQTLMKTNLPVAIAYFARGENNTINTASLAWTTAGFRDPSDARGALQSTLNALTSALGPVHAVIIDLDKWIKSDSPNNTVVSVACWSRTPIAPVGEIKNDQQFHAACENLPGRISINFFAQKTDDDTGWNLNAMLMA